MLNSCPQAHHKYIAQNLNRNLRDLPQFNCAVVLFLELFYFLFALISYEKCLSSHWNLDIYTYMAICTIRTQRQTWAFSTAFFHVFHGVTKLAVCTTHTFFLFMKTWKWFYGVENNKIGLKSILKVYYVVVTRIILLFCSFFLVFVKMYTQFHVVYNMDNFLHSALRVNNQMPFRNKMIQARKLNWKDQTTTKNCFELFTFRAIKLVDVVTVEQVDSIKERTTAEQS